MTVPCWNTCAGSRRSSWDRRHSRTPGSTSCAACCAGDPLPTRLKQRHVCTHVYVCAPAADTRLSSASATGRLGMHNRTFACALQPNLRQREHSRSSAPIPGHIPQPIRSAGRPARRGTGGVSGRAVDLQFCNRLVRLVMGDQPVPCHIAVEHALNCGLAPVNNAQDAGALLLACA